MIHILIDTGAMEAEDIILGIFRTYDDACDYVLNSDELGEDVDIVSWDLVEKHMVA